VSLLLSCTTVNLKADRSRSSPKGFQLNSWFEHDRSWKAEAGEKAAGGDELNAMARPAMFTAADKALEIVGSANMRGSMMTAQGAAGADASAICLRKVSGSSAEK
jgi:hypothetical protein